jgi:beta-glucosidase
MSVCVSFMRFPYNRWTIFVGSILSACGSGPFPGSLLSDWADMVDGFQKSALESRLGIPLIYGVDAVHGNSSIYGATIFPHNVGLGATRLVLDFVPGNLT